MAKKINDSCISCGSCVHVCPVMAIEDKNGRYVINHKQCMKDCDECAKICPVYAIEDRKTLFGF